MMKTDEQLIWEAYSNNEKLTVDKVHQILDDSWEARSSWSDSFYDLYPGYENPQKENEEYKFSSKESYEEFLQEILNFMDFDEEVVVYRAVRLEKGKESLETWMPGESWSLYRESALVFGSHVGANYLITAKTKGDDIDIEATVIRYFINSGIGDYDSEDEVVLKDWGENAEILSVEKI